MTPLIIITYRPSYSHPTPIAQFFSTSYLLSQVLQPVKSPVLVAGDFTVHIDDINDPTAKSFPDLLSVFGLS